MADEIRQRKQMAMGKGAYAGNGNSVKFSGSSVVKNPDAKSMPEKMMPRENRAAKLPSGSAMEGMANPGKIDHGPHDMGKPKSMPKMGWQS